MVCQLYYGKEKDYGHGETAQLFKGVHHGLVFVMNSFTECLRQCVLYACTSTFFPVLLKVYGFASYQQAEVHRHVEQPRTFSIEPVV
jgi:hypothetical protein